jgi:hypothetical protein
MVFCISFFAEHLDLEYYENLIGNLKFKFFSIVLALSSVRTTKSIWVRDPWLKKWLPPTDTVRKVIRVDELHSSLYYKKDKKLTLFISSKRVVQNLKKETKTEFQFYKRAILSIFVLDFSNQHCWYNWMAFFVKNSMAHFFAYIFFWMNQRINMFICANNTSKLQHCTKLRITMQKFLGFMCFVYFCCFEMLFAHTNSSNTLASE